MRGEQKRTGDNEKKPFVGVPSDQVGRGSGQDPPDARGEDEDDCPVIEQMRNEAMAERAATDTNDAGDAGGARGGRRGGGGENDADIAAVQRPPSDS